jgi:hypothetical protein
LAAGSLPSVPDLATQRYKQAAYGCGDPEPEEKVKVPYVYTDGNQRKPDPHDHQTGSKPWAATQISQQCRHPLRLLS